MLQERCVQCALSCIGLLYIMLGPYTAFGIKENVKYRDISGARQRILNVRQVKDIPGNSKSWAAIGNRMLFSADRRGHRFARATGNETTPTTQFPTVFTTSKNVTTTIKSILTNSSIPQNSTVTSFHKYYTSKFVENVNDFEDLKALYEAKTKPVIMQNFTNSRPDHIYYKVQKLKFKFPFYGHEVEQAVVTSAGFLHIGPIIHQFLHDVHYIAPLMGDFFSTPGRPVIVYILGDESRLICQWESVYEGGTRSNKSFTFQVTLFLNGTVMFTYLKIPYSVASFKSKDFPPKVGLSDGFILTKNYKIVINGKIMNLPVNTIYRYHTVSMDKNKITSRSAFIFSPVPNCIQAKTCNACFNKVIAKNFQCKWCSKLQLCSDTFDWHRQDWIANGCETQGYNSEDKCSSSSTARRSKSGSKKIIGAVVGVVLAILVLCVAGVLIYGYRRPSSRIGTMMKNYRQSMPFSTFK